MLGTLIKKQLLELNQLYFTDKKTGKRRSKAGIIGYIAFFVVIMGFLGYMIYQMAGGLSSIVVNPQQQMLESITGESIQWVYFALMGIMSILFGTFGSVFNTYNSVYKAKDNDLLLAMPIPPGKIVFARVFGVFLMSLLYSALIWIPGVIRYWTLVPVTVSTIVIPLLLTLVITLFVTVLTCILGFVVALISSHLKNKTFVTLFISLAFFALYYYFCFRMNEVLQSILVHTAELGDAIKGWVWPVYQLGLAGTGNWMGFFWFTLVSVVFFGICYYVISKSFYRLTTRNVGTKKSVYKEKKVRGVKSITSALFAREVKHLTSNASYMLNGALDVVFLIVADVFAIIYAPTVREFLGQIASELPVIGNYLPIALGAMICLMCSMTTLGSVSISLEGKNLWILQSLPVKTSKILAVKELFHMVITAVPALLTTIILGLVFQLNVIALILTILLVISFIWFNAVFGIVLNLKRPFLNWTNETMVLKQSLPIMISMFGGMILAVGYGFLYYPLMDYLNSYVYIGILAAVFAVAAFILKRWIIKRGSVIFESL